MFKNADLLALPDVVRLAARPPGSVLWVSGEEPDKIEDSEALIGRHEGDTGANKFPSSRSDKSEFGDLNPRSLGALVRAQLRPRQVQFSRIASVDKPIEECISECSDNQSHDSSSSFPRALLLADVSVLDDRPFAMFCSTFPLIANLVCPNASR